MIKKSNTNYFKIIFFIKLNMSTNFSDNYTLGNENFGDLFT